MLTCKIFIIANILRAQVRRCGMRSTTVGTLGDIRTAKWIVIKGADSTATRRETVQERVAKSLTVKTPSQVECTLLFNFISDTIHPQTTSEQFVNLLKILLKT